MKFRFILLFCCLIGYCFTQGDSVPNRYRFGVSLGSLVRYNLLFITATPSVFVMNKRHQFEFGPCIVVSSNSLYSLPGYKRRAHLDFTYNYFPIGYERRINPFVHMLLNYQNSTYENDNNNYVNSIQQSNSRKDTYNTFRILKGLGVQLKITKKLYTSVHAGFSSAFSQRKTIYTDHIDPSKSYESKSSLFDKSSSVSIRLGVGGTIGYRF